MDAFRISAPELENVNSRFNGQLAERLGQMAPPCECLMTRDENTTPPNQSTGKCATVAMPGGPVEVGLFSGSGDERRGVGPACGAAGGKITGSGTINSQRLRPG